VLEKGKHRARGPRYAIETTSGRIEEFLQKKKKLIEGAGPAQYKKHFHDKGMLAPRERIDKLVDPGTFFELDVFAAHHYKEFGMDKRTIPADGVITGFGEINGRKVAVYSQDFAALGDLVVDGPGVESYLQRRLLEVLHYESGQLLRPEVPPDRGEPLPDDLVEG
jgi:hypothetical protein